MQAYQVTLKLLKTRLERGSLLREPNRNHGRLNSAYVQENDAKTPKREDSIEKSETRRRKGEKGPPSTRDNYTMVEVYAKRTVRGMAWEWGVMALRFECRYVVVLEKFLASFLRS